MPAPAPLRLPRASVFAGVCVGVSASGHALSSGHGVAPAGLVAGFALVLAAAHGLAQRERGLGAVTALMLWCQLALHVLFSVTGPAAAVTGSHAAGHEAAGPVGGLGGAGLGPGMLLAHAAAGLACAWWLRQGERGAFDLLGLLRGLFRRLFARPSPTPPRPRPVVPSRAPVRPVFGGVLFLRHVRVLRGPPAPFPI
ncbi:hypothetical protein [Nocardiopsis sp. NRRL B-16309]|uniref:hypothetical protein n=1 Tax=Nocardiopsis sp. NRRL B-16309 TaxID=1519494 RepID=UPI001E4F1DC3|nr:hypothetical protein [Nocardiopsis sp. NRRL B-16309]